MELLAEETKQAGRAPIVTDFSLFGGKHCETSALMKAINYAGSNYSEALLFGLGGGIGFIYWNAKNMQAPFIGGRNGKFPHFLQRACNALGYEMTALQTTSGKKAHEYLRNALLAHTPTVVYGDIAYLPYFHTKRHFGGHAFVVYGIDEIAQEVSISDRADRRVTVTLDQLANARSSRHQPFSPINAQLIITKQSEVDLAQSVLSAIRFTCQEMLNPKISNIGLKGMHKIAKEIHLWPTRYGPGDLLDNYIVSFVNIELAGTGGAAFRYLYRDFLKEADRIVSSDAIKESIELIDTCIHNWHGVSAAFLPDSNPPLGEIRQLLIEKNNHFEKPRANSDELVENINQTIADLRLTALKSSKNLLSNLHSISEKFTVLEESEVRFIKRLSTL